MSLRWNLSRLRASSAGGSPAALASSLDASLSSLASSAPAVTCSVRGADHGETAVSQMGLQTQIPDAGYPYRLL